MCDKAMGNNVKGDTFYRYYYNRLLSHNEISFTGAIDNWYCLCLLTLYRFIYYKI